MEGGIALDEITHVRSNLEETFMAITGRGAVLSEWLKVRRASILGTTAAVTIALSVAAAIVGLHELDRPRRHANVALYSQTDGFQAILAHSTDFLAIVGLGFAAFAFSTEFSGGTLRNLLVRQPRRLTLFAGKSIVVAALITAFVLLAYFVAYPVALVTAPHYSSTPSGMVGPSTSAMGALSSSPRHGRSV
jgi:ABC-type transport system involved in multi-copper enzyme maturation permease subunit